MTANLEIKGNFLKTFQEGIVQGRKLLFAANHQWGDRLLTNLYYKIEKSDWLDVQKKHQLIMIIANSWWMYLNSLSKDIKTNKVDLIKYVDAYKRFFSFLTKIDDFYLLNNFFNVLLQNFMTMDDLSLPGITKFINSFCFIVREKKEYQKLIELQILLTFVRKSVFPQEFFNFSMEQIGRTIYKLEPGKRALFLHVLLENINLNFNLMEDSNEFVKTISKILINRIPSYLKNIFSDLNKIQINERNYESYIPELDELIYYLNDIGEDSWIIIIIKNVFIKLNKFSSYGDAVTYIRKFIDFAVNRNRFKLAFAIYDYLENIFLSKSDLGYDNILIELWLEAAKKFVSMNEKRFLLQSLEKLENHLKLPQSHEQIFHYFCTSNLLWQFKSIFFSLDQKEFWRMIFYRTLWEENDFDLAIKLIPHLDSKIQTAIQDPKKLYEQTKFLISDCFFFDDEEYKLKSLKDDFQIRQMIFRINSNGLITYRLISFDEEIVEGRIFNEYWNDVQLFEIFNDVFSREKQLNFDFSLIELGKIMYLFLNNSIRNFFKQFEVKSLGKVPEIYFILDQMTIPFELVYDNNFFLLKYSIGYIIGEPPLEGISFEREEIYKSTSNKNSYKVLLIECLNSTRPKAWNETTKKKELLFNFPNGIEEINYIINFFNTTNKIEEISVLTGTDSTREKILSHIKTGQYSIIHFVGNLFYSKQNPFNSYFLTNDNELVTFFDINKMLKQINHSNSPFIFFNTQMFDINGKKLPNAMRAFGDIIKKMDINYTSGILARVIPIFDHETQAITSTFYINFLNKLSQGISLLKARQECIANRISMQIEQDLKVMGEQEGYKNITIQNSKAISSFILYGKPWKKIN